MSAPKPVDKKESKAVKPARKLSFCSFGCNLFRYPSITFLLAGYSTAHLHPVRTACSPYCLFLFYAVSIANAHRYEL